MLSDGGTASPGRRAESEQEWRKESAMKANVGDWLVIKGRTTERSDQRGLITEGIRRRLASLRGAVAHHRPCGDSGSRL